MPRFAANLSFLYQEHAFLDRFAAAVTDGFEGVEYLFPYEFPADAIAARLREHGLTQVLFNLPAGDWAAGERGLACLPGRHEEFAASVDTALRYASALDCAQVHVMAGIPKSGMSPTACRRTYISNLRLACAKAADAGIRVLIEPINARDMPGYFLSRQDDAHALVAEVGADNLLVQMDFYHVQVSEGDIATKFRQYRSGVGHVQIAGVPERNEPDTGEVRYPYLFDLLDASGYSGWVGCEYRPRAGTSAGLGWLRAWREQH